MATVWQQYTTDLGRIYTFVSISIVISNQQSTNLQLADFLSNADLDAIVSHKISCSVPNLTPRKIMIFASDRSQWLFNYYEPFSQELEDSLLANLNIAAYTWIGEKIKYGRLKRMLETING